MKVVILCGGLGTRLREESEFKPKPLVEIGGKPILWHIMKIYSQNGFKDFVLCLGYKGHMIKDYFYHYDLLEKDSTITLGSLEPIIHCDNNSEKDWTITFVDTGEETLKGGRLKRIEKYISDDIFMVTYGDGVADINIKSLIDFHKSHGKTATLTGVFPISRFGELITENSRVLKFQEKPQSDTKPINGGFFVFNKKIFNYLEDREDCDLEFGVLEKLAQDSELMMYTHKGFWQCMDTPRELEYLKKAWKENKAPWKIWN